MKRIIIKISLILATIAGSACDKGDPSGIHSSGFDLSCGEVSIREKDRAVSTWYMDQYTAILGLSSAIGVPIDFGSKVEDDPASLMNKQKIALDSVKTDDLDEKLAVWAELQKNIFENLAKSLKCKVKTPEIGQQTARDKGLTYLEYQKKLMSKILQVPE